MSRKYQKMKEIMKEITGKMKQKNNAFPKALKINKKSLQSVEQYAI